MRMDLAFVPLSARQCDIYHYIKEGIEKFGYPPTVREIAAKFNIKSPNGVMCHLNSLKKKGWIERTSGLARAIKLTSTTCQPHADTASSAMSDRIEMRAQLLASTSEVNSGTDAYRCNLFLFRVDGIDHHASGIANGDTLVVQRQASIQSGALAVTGTGTSGR